MAASPADIGLLDPGVQANPCPAYDTLREHAPVWEMPGTGFFLVTSYEGIVRGIRDPLHALPPRFGANA